MCEEIITTVADCEAKRLVLSGGGQTIMEKTSLG